MSRIPHLPVHHGLVSNFARGRLGEFKMGEWRVGIHAHKGPTWAGNDPPERRLTGQLKPFREVVPVETLTFGELLRA